ncbi:hypothetical protein ACWCOP_10450 [Maricaulaceae bacterium MS644]
MRAILLLVMLFGMRAGEPTGDVTCAVPGFENLIDERGRGVILVGELHGTQEGPAAIERLACAARQRGLDTAVLFETPGQFDAVLNAAPTDRKAARAHLCETMEDFWAWSRDGRGTIAMLETWIDLSQASLTGPQLTLGAHDTNWNENERSSGIVARRADAMAARTLEALSRHDVVIVNVGKAHPTRIRNRMLDHPLYDDRPVTRIVQRFSGGEAWYCYLSRCAVRPVLTSYVMEEGERGAIMFTDTITNFEAYMFLGQASASPPVRETEICGPIEPYWHFGDDRG